MNKLKIIPIPVKKETQKISIPDPLPKMHTTFLARTGSGKTNLLLNMILRDIFQYNKYYKKIFIVSPTLNHDDNYTILESYKAKKGKAEIVMITDFEDVETVLTDILNECKSEKGKYLLILDDMLAMIDNQKKLQELYTSGRHAGLSVWCSIQSYTKIPRVCRLNTIDYIIFTIAKNELEMVASDLADDKQKFIEAYKEATNEPYGFLQVRTRATPDRRFTNSFRYYIK